MSLLGTVTNLVAGAATCTLSAHKSTKFWYIQNQDVGYLKITFRGDREGTFSSIVLGPALVLGGDGGYLDSVAFPYFDAEGFLLESSVATGQFGSGQTFAQPVNNYPYPGNQQSS